MRLRALASTVVAGGLMAALVVTGASGLSAASGAEPIAGRWEFAGGLIEFVPRSGRFVSRVIRPRPGVVCPAVNDRNGQIVLTKRSARSYAGTWVWFDAGTCRPAGKGATTITVSANGRSATMVAAPPEGVESQTITFRLRRPGAGAAATLLGSVGPGFTIALDTPRPVRPGRYTFVVEDRSQNHNFHLTGPGVNRAVTSIPFVGRGSYTAAVRAGGYTFFCDLHPTMRGSFSVS